MPDDFVEIVFFFLHYMQHSTLFFLKLTQSPPQITILFHFFLHKGNLLYDKFVNRVDFQQLRNLFVFFLKGHRHSW